MEKKLKFIIANCCQLQPASLGPDAAVNVTPNWDSFNHLQIMICVEREFSVSLDTKVIVSLTSYRDILNYLKKVSKK